MLSAEDTPIGENSIYKDQREKRRYKKDKKKVNDIVIYVVLIGIWGALVFAGYWYTNSKLARDKAELQKYIDQSLSEVQETNSLNIQMLNEKMENMESDLKDIAWALEKTGEEINVSGSSTRQELSKRMEALDKQLEELRNSLEILKESKSGKN